MAARRSGREGDADRLAERLTAYGLYKSEHGLGHHSYLVERKVFEAFRAGDPAPLLAVIDDTAGIELGIMSRSSYKQSEYLAVLLISMLVREAMEAGMDPDRAYSINDLYLQELSESHTVAEHKCIMRSAALRVHELLLETGGAQSPTVEACKSFIGAHLHKPFTSEELARHVGLTPSYLSALFSKAEGVTIKEYTLKKRVEAAENMLRYSDYPISLIAEYLCFCSQSYFSTVFKRYTGRTPLQYRRKGKRRGNE
ncbi:MAG: helix-turn-helix domain-containing protein [Clostridiales bacterium]|nr:helix-turn-helix domain-containing protein [Clostridiales bacterium]